ncbi:MAG TPA: hypothetical protein VGB63_07030 [Pedobacter sp.]
MPGAGRTLHCGLFNPIRFRVFGMGFVGELISNRLLMQEYKALREAEKMVYPGGFEYLDLN